MAEIQHYIRPGARAHLVGIGGVSMAPLAEVLQGRGLKITGSDLHESPAVDRLRSLGIPVTMACEMFDETDVLKRGAGTLLNARLIPLIADFLRAVKNVMGQRGIHAPVAIVRSDGSLMSEEAHKTHGASWYVPFHGPPASSAFQRSRDTGWPAQIRESPAWKPGTAFRPGTGRRCPLPGQRCPRTIL